MQLLCGCSRERGGRVSVYEKQDSTDTARQYLLSVRQQGGAIVTLQCSNSLMVSDVISQLAPGSAVLVYHRARPLRNDVRIHTLELDAGCCCLEIHELLDGGGGGCSRIRPVDDVSVMGNADISANAQGLNRTIGQPTSATVTATEGQTSQLSRIVDEQKIELGNLQREKEELAAASAKEISGLRLRVVELETQLGKAHSVNATSSARLGAEDTAGYFWFLF